MTAFFSCISYLNQAYSIEQTITFFSDKIATGSFDKTCKLWNAQTGQCYFTYRGHTSEIVCLSFNPQSTLIATGSMDATAKLWDVQSGAELLTLTVSVLAKIIKNA